MEKISVAVDARVVARLRIKAKEAGLPLGDFVREVVLKKVAEVEQEAECGADIAALTKAVAVAFNAAERGEQETEGGAE